MSKQKITLACGVCKARNYRVAKSTSPRLVIKKFCKKCQAHTLHREEK